jgi:hypothetical protein
MDSVYDALKEIGDHMYLVTSKKSGTFDYFVTGEEYVTTTDCLNLEFKNTAITTTFAKTPTYKGYAF